MTDTEKKSEKKAEKKAERCIYFKPQRTEDKRDGCVQRSRFNECAKCAYNAPAVKA